MKLPSVDSLVTATHTPDGIKGNINPPFLGGPVELPDALTRQEPVKGAGINEIMLEIIVLHMKNHCISP
jgi:hypothetical protein